MNTELIKTNGAAAPAQLTQSYPVDCRYFRWTDEDYAIAKEQKGKDLTDAEFRYFIKVATARGLNPLLNQIYAIRRYSSSRNDRGDWVKTPTMTIQTAIEGFVIIAERTGRYEGCKTWTTGNLSDGSLKAHAIVYKRGSRDVEVEIDWDEFKQTSSDKNGTEKLSGLWAKMPKWMLQKIALARALSRAFPEDLSGLYTSDEMPEAPEPQKVEGPAAKLPDLELGPTYDAQLAPPQTTIEPLENPWLYQVTRNGKTTTFAELHEKKPEWFNNILARYQHRQMTEEEYVNASAALEQPELKPIALQILAEEAESSEQ